MNKEEQKESKIKFIKSILESHNIKMNVLGCGCCGSPNVSFTYNGNEIVKDEDEFNFEMIDNQ